MQAGEHTGARQGLGLFKTYTSLLEWRALATDNRKEGWYTKKHIFVRVGAFSVLEMYDDAANEKKKCRETLCWVLRHGSSFSRRNMLKYMHRRIWDCLFLCTCMCLSIRGVCFLWLPFSVRQVVVKWPEPPSKRPQICTNSTVLKRQLKWRPGNWQSKCKCSVPAWDDKSSTVLNCLLNEPTFA